MAHTPGPWQWINGNYQTLVSDTREHLLWYTNDDDGVHCEPDNARLIAAAPELLKACELVVEHYRGTSNHREAIAYTAVLDAIAKAKGGAE